MPSLANGAAPWLAEPYSLLEHHDMYRFYTPKFMAAVARFGRSCGQFMERFSTYQTDEITAEMLTAVTEMQEGLQDAALSGPVRFQMDQLKKTLEGNGMFDNMTEREIFQQAKLFHDSLLIELSSRVYLVIPSTKRTMFLAPDKWYGEKAWTKFNGDAGEDMRSAAHCFALGQWTATVFHSMRVLEHGLRGLANRVSVSFPHPLELENWQTIIEAIDSKIKAMKALPKGQTKSEETEFCSRAASHFWHFKDAWRNHVSHSRRTYDEEEARQVVEHVRDFMTALAA